MSHKAVATGKCNKFPSIHYGELVLLLESTEASLGLSLIKGSHALSIIHEDKESLLKDRDRHQKTILK